MAPVSHEQYVLADGSSIMMDTTVGQLEFEGKIVGGTIVFGDAHAEPLPGHGTGVRRVRSGPAHAAVETTAGNSPQGCASLRPNARAAKPLGW